VQQTTEDRKVSEENRVFSDLEKLRQFSGQPTAFWRSYLEAGCRLTGAESGVIQIRQATTEWRAIARNPQDSTILAELKRAGVESAEWYERAREEVVVTTTFPGRSVGEERTLLVVDLTPDETTTSVMGLFLMPSGGKVTREEAVDRLRLGRDVPTSFTIGRRLARAEESVESFASVLDLLRVMDSRHRYLEAVMTLCNEAASRFRCARVSIGWLVNGDVRLQAISHTEKIEKKMRAVLALEEVMEEALDQDEEVIVPSPDGSDVVTRCHESFAEEQSADNVASLPLRLDDAAVAVLTLERATEEFDEAEMRSLRLLCDQVATRLSDLKKHDRWFGSRLWASFREKAAKLMGVENTGWKLIGLAISIALGVLIFGGSIYRIEAPFILKSDTLAQIPAAFDGYIREVHFHVGDKVEAKAPLLELDQRELLLEEGAAVAELRRHRSDALRAEAEGELAKMRSALALADQVEAKVKMAQYRLSQSRIEAPFEGVVVEGDLRERIGSPVQQGEVLLKLARLDPMYVETKVAERNIHLLAEGRVGEIAFASRPDEKFPIVVERIEPLAIPEEGGSIFLVRCRITAEDNDWWRPGMSGLCKIESERRSYLWMLTHRTVDFLRMKLWW
jgi:hypothetical protein